MTGFTAIYRKELTEIRRTWRLWVIPGIILFSALTGPFIARYMKEILSSVAGEAVNALIVPDPTYVDSYLQWTNNLGQIVIIALIVTAGSAITRELRTGTAVAVLTRPVTRAAFVLAKFAADATLLLGSLALGTLLTWGLTLTMFPDAPLLDLVGATAAWATGALLLLAVTVAASASLSSGAGASGIALLVFLGLTIAGIWPPALSWTPAGALSAATPIAIGQGDGSAIATALTVTILLTAAVLALAIAVFRRREI